MQRHAALRDLSSDHHVGLVLARKARQAASGSIHERQLVWQMLVDQFDAELEPHFRREEEDLLPAMQQAGESQLVDRTLREHKELRKLVAENRFEHLARFAELLSAHIRFEEKELFERAQQVLDLERLGQGAESGATPPT